MGRFLLFLLGGLLSSRYFPLSYLTIYLSLMMSTMSPRLCSAYEGSGGGDMCWDGQCHPHERCTDCYSCSSCPTADLASWREPEDVWYTVACRRDSAVVRLGLEPMLIDVGWLDGVSAEIVYTSKSGTDVLYIDNLLAEEVEVVGLRPGSKYSFSLNIKKGSAEKRFLPQVSFTIYLYVRAWCHAVP